MNIKMIVFMALVFTRVAFSQSIQPPFERITSDFGPRNVIGGTWFHQGIDYNPIVEAGFSKGIPIPAVNHGVIDFIDYEGLKKVIIDSGSNKEWSYLHIFSNTYPKDENSVTSGACLSKNQTIKLCSVKHCVYF
ncbi:MAG: hypothetical protein A2252_02725 [Elusimicrobia bacterium RIFOXYA2_FULL_39_19]|nr:MAG: hypothetical protein A2252_02725 [Elusimicrobia bacterium RIFOXYA2_FULL_39_19]